MQYEGNLNVVTDTPFGYTLTMIGGKWRLIILYWLVDRFIGSGAADAEIDAGFAQCTVALDGDTVVGFVICKENLLHLIMVDTHFQRRGYGVQLLQAAEREIGQKHSAVELQSFSENTAAQCFYKKHGYRITQTKLDESIGQGLTVFQKVLAHENE